VASGTTLQIVLTDSNGDTTSSTDLDISGATSVSNLLADLNSISGVSATISNGHLEITNSSGGGIAVATESGTVGGTDLSSYFGLNDLVTGGSSAATIAVNPALLASSDLLPSGTLETPQTVGSAAVGASDATIATKLEAALTSNQSFAAAGALGGQSTSFTDYAAAIVSDVASKYSSATDSATTTSTALSTLTSQFDAQSGVNTDNETAKLQSLENAYAASAQVITAVKSMFTALLTAVQS
jgi:flagellar hook-associated protein 1 FlgK